MRWDLHTNDSIDDADLMGDWYTLFNKCEGELLLNIIKRRQFKLRGIKTNLTELKNLLVPFVHLKEYKDKEKELQESIKKYDSDIQANKQKKFKRDVLDYKNSTVYKWQVSLDDQQDELEDLSMDESSEEPILTRPLGMLGFTTRRMEVTSNPPYSQERPAPSNRQPGRRDVRRDDYQAPLDYRTPTNNRYNIPTYNRFSPLRRYEQRSPHSLYRREFGEERGFPRAAHRDRPPGRWRPCIPYRNSGWRGQNGNRGRAPGENHQNMREEEAPNADQQHTPWNQERLLPRKKHGTHTQEPRKRKQTRGRRGGKKKKKKARILGQGIFNLSNTIFPRRIRST